MSERQDFRAYIALVAVYFFWGTTYLAIRIALESFAPLFLIGARFLLSGTIMLLAAWLSGAVIPRGREFWRAAACGVVVLGGGTGALVFAEQIVPSGIAALMITTGPFWMVGIESAMGGERLHFPTLGGILVGSIGVVLLFAPGGRDAAPHSGLLAGFLILQLSCVLWSLGSLMQRRQTGEAHPIVTGAVQQLATGVVFSVPALLTHSLPAHVSARSLWAGAWLVVFGSIVGYSAFVYAMHHLPVAVVTTYNYVNPIVAVALGRLFYGEPFGAREALAMGIIFVGVALVKWTTRKGGTSPLREPSPPVLHPPPETPSTSQRK